MEELKKVNKISEILEKLNIVLVTSLIFIFVIGVLNLIIIYSK